MRGVIPGRNTFRQSAKISVLEVLSETGVTTSRDVVAVLKLEAMVGKQVKRKTDKQNCVEPGPDGLGSLVPQAGVPRRAARARLQPR